MLKIVEADDEHLTGSPTVEQPSIVVQIELPLELLKAKQTHEKGNKKETNVETENCEVKEEASLTKKSLLGTSLLHLRRNNFMWTVWTSIPQQVNNAPNGDDACEAIEDELPSQPPAPWPGDATPLLVILLPTFEAVYYVLAFPWTHSSRRGEWQWKTLFHGRVKLSKWIPDLWDHGRVELSKRIRDLWDPGATLIILHRATVPTVSIVPNAPHRITQ
jgi:hypothetical protein